MLTTGGCPKNMLAIKDAIEAVEGKWKLLILIALSAESKRFKELAKELNISDKMLSKELKALEANKLVKKETDELTSAAAYSITDHGRSLEKVMQELSSWGLGHRKEVIGE